jgi:hypothetical protein
VRRFLIDENTLRVCRESLINGLQGDQEDGYIDGEFLITADCPAEVAPAIVADLAALEALTAAMGGAS